MSKQIFNSLKQKLAARDTRGGGRRLSQKARETPANRWRAIRWINRSRAVCGSAIAGRRRVTSLRHRLPSTSTPRRRSRRIPPPRSIRIQKPLTSPSFLQFGDTSLRLLECLPQQQRTLHHQVRRIRLLLNRARNQSLRFRILVDAANLNELGEKAFEQGAFLWGHGPPLEFDMTAGVMKAYWPCGHSPKVFQSHAAVPKPGVLIAYALADGRLDRRSCLRCAWVDVPQAAAEPSGWRQSGPIAAQAALERSVASSEIAVFS